MDLAEVTKRLKSLRKVGKKSVQADLLLPPPRPLLLNGRELTGGRFQFSWSIPLGLDHAEVDCFEIHACIQKDRTPDSSPWKLIRSVPFKTLSMCKIIGNFEHGFRYHLAVRAVDVYGRMGVFSVPTPIQRSTPAEKFMSNF